jgi:hypothetical protein
MRRRSPLRKTIQRALALRWPGWLAVLVCGALGTLLPAAAGAIAGVPEAGVHDEFGYLLTADTFAHGRLSNPPPSHPEFFEAPHLLVEPTYNSKYPPGQAALLALGQVLTGQPIWGVWFSCGLFAASLCWMLAAWVSKPWAVATTIVAMATLGGLTYWAQSYWGGMPAASGSALLLGGFRRLWDRPASMPAVLAAIGLVVLANTRPYEGMLVAGPALAILGWRLLVRSGAPLRALFVRVVAPAAAVVAAGGIWIGVYNHAVTGRWSQMPYALHETQYSYQDVFAFSQPRVPSRQPVARLDEFNRSSMEVPVEGVQLLAYMLRRLHERGPATIESAFGVLDVQGGIREPFRGQLLWLTAIGLLFLRRRWFRFCACLLGVGLLGGTVVRWWLPHYGAALVPLVLACGALILDGSARALGPRVRRIGPLAVAVLAVCYLAVPFLIRRLPASPTPLQAATAVPAKPLTSYASRAAMRRELEQRDGLDLVFVDYADGFTAQRGEWVYNGADLATAPVIFAHDLGRDRNTALIAAHPARIVWRVSVSDTDARLERYQ